MPAAIPPTEVTVSTIINAPAAAIFDLLANPARHVAIDGNAQPTSTTELSGVGQIRGLVRGPDRLYLGAKFAMRMRLGIPYVLVNRVVEFEEGRRIAWTHLSHARWRYELEPITPTQTRVTETFDMSRSWLNPLYQRVKVLQRNESGMRRTLTLLADIIENPDLRESGPGTPSD